MTKQVSVIVPVYKAEKYIHRCIDSILGQTFADFELILVDDGSPDNSGAICDEYAAKDSRIRVIHQENGGAAAARNQGIAQATGSYLAFCDSDDVVGPVWLERMLQYAAPGTLVMGSYCSDPQVLGKEKVLPIPATVVWEANRYFDFNDIGIAGYLWNALYETSVIREHSLKIREKRAQGDYNEDLLFALQYVQHMQKLVYTGYADYCYDTHEGSLSRSYGQFYFPKYEEKFWLWYDHLKCFRPEDRAALRRLADTMIYHFLTAMQREACAGVYRKFRQMVKSPAVGQCVTLSDCAKENPRVIGLLRKQASARLWPILKLCAWKGRK